MPSKTIFRILVVVWALLNTASTLIETITFHQLPKELRLFLESKQQEPVGVGLQLIPSLVFALLLLLLIVLIIVMGLLLLKNWARWVNLVLGLVSFAYFPLLGIQIQIPSVRAMEDAATALWGAFTLMSFLPPLSAMFVTTDPAKNLSRSVSPSA